MTIGVVQAECVNCKEGFRFKRGKSKRVIRDMLVHLGAYVFIHLLENGRVGCVCKRCLQEAGHPDKIAKILKPYKKLGTYVPKK